MVNFTYGRTCLKDIKVNTSVTLKGHTVVDSVEVCGMKCRPTNRFWRSLMSRYGFSNSIFKYFEYHEVFDRISARAANDNLRVCIESTPDASGNTNLNLLAASSPGSPVMEYDSLISILNDYGITGYKYHDGMVVSNHVPRINQDQQIGPDTFAQRFTLATPIDGYGAPMTHLTLLRSACNNGMVAWDKAFRATVNIGKGDDDVAHSIERVIESYANDEGFVALRDRVEMAMKSPASVHEAYTLLKLLHNLVSARDIDLTKRSSSAPFFEGVRKKAETRQTIPNDSLAILYMAASAMTGDFATMYGLVNPDEFSIKKRRTLPTRATVMDLINFATEIGTHYSTPKATCELAWWFGSVVSNEFDLEAVDATKIKDFDAFCIDQRLVAGVTG